MIWLNENWCIYNNWEVAIDGEKLQSKEMILNEEKWMQLFKKEDDSSWNSKIGWQEKINRLTGFWLLFQKAVDLLILPGWPI